MEKIENVNQLDVIELKNRFVDIFRVNKYHDLVMYFSYLFKLNKKLLLKEYLISNNLSFVGIKEEYYESVRLYSIKIFNEIIKVEICKSVIRIYVDNEILLNVVNSNDNYNIVFTSDNDKYNSETLIKLLKIYKCIHPHLTNYIQKMFDHQELIKNRKFRKMTDVLDRIIDNGKLL